MGDGITSIIIGVTRGTGRLSLSSLLSELAISTGSKKEKCVEETPKIDPEKKAWQEKKEKKYREIHEQMRRGKPEIGPDLATFVAKWGEYRKYQGYYWRSSRVLY